MNRLRRKFDSIAIAVINRGSNSVPIDLSINLWADMDDASEIDFGLQVPIDPEVLGCFVFIPFDVNSAQIKDLSTLFEDADFNQLLFNRDCKTQTAAEGTLVTGSGNLSNLVAPFSTENGLVLNHLAEGTLLSFTFAPFDDDALRGAKNRYVRFRVPYPLLDNALSGFDDLKEAITGPVVPFRSVSSIEINQIRGLPDSIVRKLTESKTVIRETHIAVIADRRWTISSTLSPYRVRLLENRLWDEYQPKLKTDRTFLHPEGCQRFVYQWLIKGNGRSLQLEFSRKRITILTLAFYLIILFFINLISEMLIRLVL